MTRIPIRILPDGIVGRIAAGEVVERPGSVVKELVENALDAGATRIQVEVEGGLTGLIRVADNGAGIPAEDLPLAVHRHATSKIASDEDLLALGSLGFRGEGLAAIGAVSRLRMVSRPSEATVGAEIVVEGGAIGAPVPCARERGTTVEVRDLFFSTPARRKFLKSPASEYRVVYQTLEAYGFAFPQVHFSLVVEGRETLQLPPAADRHERATQILGRERLARMIPVGQEDGELAVEGFLGAPEDSRARMGHQIFLVNGRWVWSPVLRVAAREAYGDLIPPSRHPEAILELRIPVREVDVNVHPTKREVRLTRERELYPRLIRLLKAEVAAHIPALGLGAGAPFRPISGTGTGSPSSPGRQVGLGLVVGAGSGAGWVNDMDRSAAESPSEAAPESAGSGEAGETPALASMWQLHETYVMAAIEGGLLIIDQHAAHERVLYERALRRLQGEPAPSQELLFPLTVDLTHEEFSVLLEMYKTLEALGFHLEQFGGTTVMVRAIPAGLREWRHGALLRDVLDHFSDLPTSLDVDERVARSVACQGAVKAGQRLTLAEMNALVDQLFATDKPEGDPHGRPVYLRMGIDELHRRFGRSG